MKKCAPLWREAHFQVKMYKTQHARTTFGSSDVEKVHAVVARSTFPSQNVQNTPAPDHFWRFRWRKSARRCGAKHISKSKCTKHTSSGPLLEVQMAKKCTPLWREAHFQVKMYKTHHVVARSTFPSQNVHTSSGPLLEVQMSKKCTPLWREAHFQVKMYKTMLGPLLEVQMSKKCTPLWREAHFQVKMYKTHQLRTTFGSSDVEKVHAVVARSTFRSQNVQNTPCSDHFWRFRCRKSARRCGAKHISKSKCIKHTSSGPLLEVQMSKKCTPLWREAHFEVKMYKTHHARTTFGGFTTHHDTTLQLPNYIPLQLHSTALNYTTPQYMTLHYTTLRYTTTLHYLPLHFATLHYTILNYTTTTTTTTLHYTTLQYTTLH